MGRPFCIPHIDIRVILSLSLTRSDTMSIDLLITIVAFIMFILSGFSVPRANWMCFGFAALTLTLIV